MTDHHSRTRVRPSTDEKTVSVLWIKALLLAAEQQGVATAELLHEAQLAPERLQHNHARISLTETLRLWRVAERLANNNDFGLRMGEWVKPSHFQLFALILLHSENLGAAFEKSIRYSRLLSEGGRYFLQHDGDEAAICYEPQALNFSRHQVDAVLVLLRSFANWLACRRVPLLRVECEHSAPADVSQYQRIFACPVRFDAGRNALVFAAELMQEPLALGDEHLAAMHERMLEDQLALLNQSDEVTRLIQWLRDSDTLALERDDFARQLHISGRSLQRKLNEQGTSFQQLLNEERHRRALQLLAETDCSMTDIGEQLGFAESSGFTRAFRRWQGCSPQAYRLQVQHS